MSPGSGPAQRAITRRDFLNGVAVGACASGAARALRDGKPLPHFSRGDETVDLVVVGAGISGLAAAWLYRRHAGRAVRILLLEALPHVGGHALRNEFVASNGRRIIGYGGSEALDTPSLWSPAAHSLIRGIGIDLRQFESWYDRGFRQRHGLLQSAQYCAPEIWGRGALVRHAADAAPADWIAQTPLAGPARPGAAPTEARALRKARAIIGGVHQRGSSNRSWPGAYRPVALRLVVGSRSAGGRR